jgi:hypothetical protein
LSPTFFRPFAGVLALLSLPLLPLAARAEAPAWVARSDKNADVLLEVMARTSPEQAADLGIPGLDEEIFDLKPGSEQRERAALEQALATLRQRLAAEKDAAVRQDLEILIRSAEQDIESSQLGEKLRFPYFNASQAVFGSLRSLLDDQVEPGRRPAALVRLRKYTGLEPGYTPLTRLAEDRMRERLGQPGLLFPFKEQVERDLANSAAFVKGLGELFGKYQIKGYEEPLARLGEQVAAHEAFVRKEVLPKARTDFRLPAELYALNLEQVGVDMPVDELVSRAEVSFREIQNEMQALAPLVAKEKGIAATDYREVFRELKKRQVEGDAVLPLYQQRIKEVEEIIRRERIVTLPVRPMRFRLASEAESAASPAPNFQPPRLIGNTGEEGEFVLPMRIPGQGRTLQYDDFSFDAFTWPLTAHEGRPGHELQFASLVEKGVSKARAIFAFNSVNVEGWALYAESEIRPYLPLDGQFALLQSRLMRAARAILDPGLQRGEITREEATRILREEVGLSEAMALQEVQRYTFRSPGQATAYFLGYNRLIELRAEVERLLGPKFDRMKYHDFILSQGLLPPSLLRKAVLEEFVPSQK